MTITIRPEHEEDAVAIAHVHRQAFGQENEARLVNAIRGIARYPAPFDDV